MDLVNLCHSHFHTKVECDKPNNDDYDINNLLLDNDKGFLVYSCIKPPVNIDFDFISNVKLSHIKIWPSVGAQKSTGFKISVKTGNNNTNSIGKLPSYYQISSGYLTKNENGIIFCCSDNASKHIKVNENFAIRHIKNDLKLINNVTGLRLTIEKTENSVVAIKRIEIWAHNSSKKFQKLCSENNKHLLLNNVECKKNSVQEDEVYKKSETLLNKLKEVPEEYLDPLTCTIMIQPIILPSGKIIDFSTLEKFGENEALWGRPLSDPFTGVSFNNNYKPIFADSIKSQIDKFLTKNNDFPEFQKIPRVLGPHRLKSTAIQQHRSEMLKLPHIYRTANQRYSAIPLKASDLKSSSNKHSEVPKLKHNMPINVHKLKNLLTERKKLNTRKLNITNLLDNNLTTTNSVKNTCINVINDVNSNLSNQNSVQIERTEETHQTNTNIDKNLQNNLNSILFSLKNFSQTKTSDT